MVKCSKMKYSLCYCKNVNYLGPRYNIKNPLCTFCRIHMMSLCAKFQLSSFKTEGGDRGDRRTDGRTDGQTDGRHTPTLYVHTRDFLWY